MVFSSKVILGNMPMVMMIATIKLVNVYDDKQP